MEELPASREGQVQEAEAGIIEMLKWALLNGGEQARQHFSEAHGLTTVLSVIFRRGRAAFEADPQQAIIPDARARSLLNAMVKAEGDKFPSHFTSFLMNGGCEVLIGAAELQKQIPAFSEFMAKMLWIVWDVETQRAMMDEGNSREALALLSGLFGCNSAGARVCAGLLLSCLLVHGFLLGKEEQAAFGIAGLAEELVAGAPAWACEGSQDPADGELVTFVQALGASEKGMSRIINTALAPFHHEEQALAEEGSPLWACCSLALWCLLRIRAKDRSLTQLRPILPTYARAAPAKVRWLSGELLLMLQLQAESSPSSGSAHRQREVQVQVVRQERLALETALLEQLEQSRHAMRGELEHSSEVVLRQRSLAEERRKRLEVETPKVGAEAQRSEADWHTPLDTALTQLRAARDSLLLVLQTAEAQKDSAEVAVRHVLQLELQTPASALQDSEMERLLGTLEQLEEAYETSLERLKAAEAAAQLQEEAAGACNSDMELADQAVQEKRRRIATVEADMDAKQHEAQSKRTMATSDLAGHRTQLAAELEAVKQQQAKLRERALRLQAKDAPDERTGSVPDQAAVQEEMGRLRAEAAQLKARTAELQEEHLRFASDPEVLLQQARDAEDAAHQLSLERESLRAELVAFEGEHFQARQAWQEAMSSLQQARHSRDAADLKVSDLRRQLEAAWSSWQPLWHERLKAWQGRATTLARARQGGWRFSQAVARNWDGFQREQALRQEALAVVSQLQQSLAHLAQELSAVDDGPVG